MFGMRSKDKGKVCDCAHHKVVPILIVLIGFILLLQGLDVISAQITNVVWPILLMITGLTKMSEDMCRCC